MKTLVLPVRSGSVSDVFRFTTTAPPEMITGFIRSSRNGSVNWGSLPGLSCGDVNTADPRVNTPLLRRRIAPSRPYPSCPVPAAGPFRIFFSCLSEDSASGAGADFFLPKNGNRELNVETFGLGVRAGRAGSVFPFFAAVASFPESTRRGGTFSCLEGCRW